VTVVIAVRNGSAFLAEALDSAQAQTWPAIEIVVVDGHSTDGSREIAESRSGVRVLLQQGSGFAGAWNEGIRSGRGVFVAFLDSDDRWEPEKLQLQVAALEAAPARGYALSHTRLFLSDGVTLPPELSRIDLSRPHAAPFPSALLCRRRLFDEIGFFEEQWSIASDVEWIRRLRDRGIEGVVLPEALTHRRIHEANLSSGAPGSAFKRELLSILSASLARRRRESARRGSG
jgi:glycosyltransferase involved in cell wall biosynthesis